MEDSFRMTTDHTTTTDSSSINQQDSFNGTINPRRESSMGVARLVTFVGDAARGILFPVLWPLCQMLGGSRIMLGYLVATFSIGRLLVTTRLGIIADTNGHRKALIISGIVLIIGSLLWANAPFLGGLAMLYLAQLTLGLGTGSLGVTRSYVAEQTDPSHRTHKLANLSALQYAGFAATPLLGSLFVMLGNDISSDWSFALPSYLLFLLGVICLGLLIHPFTDYIKNDAEDIKSCYSEDLVDTSPSDHITLNPIQANKENDPVVVTPKHDMESQTASSLPLQQQEKSFDTHARGYVYYLMMFLNFSTRGAIAVFETQASHMLLDEYNLSQIWLGLIVSIAGSIGTLQLIYFQQLWCRNFSDFTLMVGGLGLLGVAQLFAMSWSALGEDVHSSKSMWRFVVALYLVYALAYPVGNSAVLGIFSILQKTGKQGKTQSLFAFMGSFARVVCPIISGYMEQYVKTGASFGFVLILVTISIFAVMVLRAEILYCYHATSQDKVDRLQFIGQSTLLHSYFTSGHLLHNVDGILKFLLISLTHRPRR
eukprot:gene5842-6433_t